MAGQVVVDDGTHIPVGREQAELFLAVQCREVKPDLEQIESLLQGHRLVMGTTRLDAGDKIVPGVLMIARLEEREFPTGAVYYMMARYENGRDRRALLRADGSMMCNYQNSLEGSIAWRDLLSTAGDLKRSNEVFQVPNPAVPDALAGDSFVDLMDIRERA